MQLTPRLLSFLLSAGLASIAAAQGDDTCATAQPIAGLGSFPFDTTLATTDGVGDPLCLAFGTDLIHNDVWWAWTAPNTALVRVETCGQTSLDTRLAAYDGGACAPPSPILACNDDTCSLQSRIEFPATAGHVYWLRLGAFSASGFGTGNITISQPTAPTIERSAVNPANGHTYHQLSSSTWTHAEVAAVALGGHLATVDDQAEHDWIVANFHNYLGSDIDLFIGFNDAAVEGSFAWVSGAPVGYTNWSAGEPNNAGTGEDYAIIRKNSAIGEWNDVPDDPQGFHAGPHGLVEVEVNSISSFCAGDGLDPNVTTACPCGNFGSTGNGCANSTNAAGANLAASGSPNPDTVVLAGSGMPATVACIYLQGDALTDIVFGDGVRCAGGTLIRLRTKVNVGGASTFPDSTDTVTVSQRGQVMPGSGLTRFYQTYYRNAAAAFCPPATFNVTNGNQIVW